MSIFFLVVFSLYGGLHYYVYTKLTRAFELTLPGVLAIIALFVLMILTPVMVRVAERQELELLARVLAYVGYGWMGIVFLFFSLSLLFDLYALLVKILALLGPRCPLPTAKQAFLWPLALAVLLAIFGAYQACQIKTETLTITTPKLPAPHDRLRLALISDVHLGVIVGRDRLARIMARVQEAKPDILLSLGDLIDGQLDNVEEAIPLLAAYRPPLGKYAVVGNHEYIVGLDQAAELTRRAGFTLLRGESTTVGGLIDLVGLDDPAAGRFGQRPLGDARELLTKLSRERFILVMKHQPIVRGDTLGLFDLQVSGHIHGGQIFPFYLLSLLAYRFPVGLTPLGQGSSLYVTRGSGTWGPPIRFLAPPEVTVIDLIAPPRP